MHHHLPVKLTSPRVWRTYQGGSQIDAIHGIPDGQDSQFPEEWIMSVVNARNAGREHIPDEGLCYLEGTSLTLRDFILENPEAALGQQHVQKWGSTTGLLVKILDAAERLTIQVHPDKQRAMELFGSQFGKTECWHILGCRSIDSEEPCIYLGFRPGITREEWQRIFVQQDIPAMLKCLHRFPVKPGETYLVHGGVPHAIGPGCLLVEIQEPTDLTVRTERISPKGLKIRDEQCHQGLGFEKMFDCFAYQGQTLEEATSRWCIPPKVCHDDAEYTCTELIGSDHTDCFRLIHYEIRERCEIAPGNTACGIYVLQGAGVILAGGQSLSAKAGDQFFVPAACESFVIRAEQAPLVVFQCLGPAV